MGLDMGAYKVRNDHALDDFTVRSSDQGDPSAVERIWSWRKHHDLHGWMQALYEQKCREQDRVSDPTFNCCDLRLTEQDLDDLVEAICGRELPETTGFFFGNNPPDDMSDRGDLEFVAAARAAIREGYSVYYSAWY